jgi:hypothetical protein
MSMGKKAARELACRETLSVGALRAMVSRARLLGGPSAVNPQFTLAETCGIYERALQGRADDERPKATRPDFYSRQAGATKSSCDLLIVTNILRDCGP